MLTNIINTLWLDLDRLVRVEYDRYSLDFKDKTVTYMITAEESTALQRVLAEEKLTRLSNPLELLTEKLHDAE